MNQVTCRSGLKIHLTGLKKVPFSHPGQVDFPAGHLTFPSKSFFTCLMAGQGPRKDSKLRLTQGEQNLRAVCPKGKLKFMPSFFFEPCTHNLRGDFYRGLCSQHLELVFVSF